MGDLGPHGYFSFTVHTASHWRPGDHLSGPYSENLYYRWVMGKWVDVQTSFSSWDREAGWESLS